jgi:hypothetical protein
VVTFNSIDFESNQQFTYERGGPEVLFLLCSSAAPQRTAYSKVTIPEGSPSKDWQSTV